MKLVLDWGLLKVTIEAEGLGSELDLILMGGTCLETARELEYGTPEAFMTTAEGKRLVMSALSREDGKGSGEEKDV